MILCGILFFFALEVPRLGKFQVMRGLFSGHGE